MIRLGKGDPLSDPLPKGELQVLPCPAPFFHFPGAPSAPECAFPARVGASNLDQGLTFFSVWSSLQKQRKHS